MPPEKMERETGFEPATSTLARLHSTAELFPPIVYGTVIKLQDLRWVVKAEKTSLTKVRSSELRVRNEKTDLDDN